LLHANGSHYSRPYVRTQPEKLRHIMVYKNGRMEDAAQHRNPRDVCCKMTQSMLDGYAKHKIRHSRAPKSSGNNVTDDVRVVITGPPTHSVGGRQITVDGIYMLYVVVCRRIVYNAAGGRAGLPPGAWAVGPPSLHGGPVRLRSVTATPCWKLE